MTYLGLPLSISFLNKESGVQNIQMSNKDKTHAKIAFGNMSNVLDTEVSRNGFFSRKQRENVTGNIGKKYFLERKDFFSNEDVAKF